MTSKRHYGIIWQMEKVSTHIRLEKRMHEQIRKIAFARRYSINKVMREAIGEYIEHRDKKTTIQS